MRIKLQSLYESEGHRIESVNTDPERAQVTLLWDERRALSQKYCYPSWDETFV